MILKLQIISISLGHFPKTIACCIRTSRASAGSWEILRFGGLQPASRSRCLFDYSSIRRVRRLEYKN